MNLPDKCPFCGAGIHIMKNGEKCVAKDWVTFECQTWIRDGLPVRSTQSRQCEEVERLTAKSQLSAARARVAELEARCKRLETAARALYIDCITSGARWTKAQTKHMHALRDVLEEKK